MALEYKVVDLPAVWPGKRTSYPKRAPFKTQWARTLVRECREADVPVFVKQLGAVPVQRENGVVVWPEFDLHDRHGGDMAEWPEDLRIREFPAGASALGGME